MTALGLIAEGVQCTRCGYDLRGLKENRCPECGEEFDPEKFPSARVPWLVERDEIWGPYLATVWLVLRHPWKLGELVWAPVSVDAGRAESFRRISMWIAIVTACAGAGLVTWIDARDLIDVIIVVLVVMPAAWSFFELATRPARERSHWSQGGQQDMRSFGLYHFCCAPLALTPMVLVAMGGASLMGSAPPLVGTVGAVALGVVMAIWWLLDVAFYAASTRGLLGDGVRAGIMVLVNWLAFAVVSAILCGMFSLVTFGVVVPWLLNLINLWYRR